MGEWVYFFFFCEMACFFCVSYNFSLLCLFRWLKSNFFSSCLLDTTTSVCGDNLHIGLSSLLYIIGIIITNNGESFFIYLFSTTCLLTSFLGGLHGVALCVYRCACRWRMDGRSVTKNGKGEEEDMAWAWAWAWVFLDFLVFVFFFHGFFLFFFDALALFLSIRPVRMCVLELLLLNHTMCFFIISNYYYYPSSYSSSFESLPPVFFFF
jgi:hypothetical protein